MDPITSTGNALAMIVGIASGALVLGAALLIIGSPAWLAGRIAASHAPTLSAPLTLRVSWTIWGISAGLFSLAIIAKASVRLALSDIFTMFLAGFSLLFTLCASFAIGYAQKCLKIARKEAENMAPFIIPGEVLDESTVPSSRGEGPTRLMPVVELPPNGQHQPPAPTSWL